MSSFIPISSSYSSGEVDKPRALPSEISAFFLFRFHKCLLVYTVCVELLMVFFSINRQNLFEVAATSFIADTAATHQVLVQPLKDLWSVLNNFTRCFISNYHIRHEDISDICSLAKRTPSPRPPATNESL